MVNNDIIELILHNTVADERDIYVIKHLLSGGKQRECVFEDKTLNPNTVSTIRSRCIPFVQFERNGEVSIVDANAPEWLKNSNLYIPTQAMQVKEQVSQQRVRHTVKRSKQEAMITLVQHEELLNALRLELIEDRKTAVITTAANTTGLVKEKVGNELTTYYQGEIQKLITSNREELANQKEELRVKYLKEAADLFQRQTIEANKKVEILQAALDKLNGESAAVQKQLADEIESKTNIETNNTKLVSDIQTKESTIQGLLADIEKLRPKYDRSFIVQATVSFFWLSGLTALSIFSIENMLIYFNAGSFYIVSVILGIFIEFMLWATNITRFADSLNDKDSVEQSNDLSKVIFIFRAGANSLGGFYIATNAAEYAEKSGLYASLSTKFTDINELYFGLHLGTFGMIVTACIIGGFVAYMEYKALPLAIRHAYNLFIKKI